MGATTYRFDPPTRRLIATCGSCTFQPVAGFGPCFLLGGSQRSPSEAATALLGTQRSGSALACRYRATAGGESAYYTVTLSPARGGLRIAFHSVSRRCARVLAGTTRGLGPWFRFNYTRNAEPYGQAFWPRVAWAPASRVFVSAVWDMAVSNGSVWDAPDQRFRGSGDFAAGLDVVYTPRTDGSRIPLQEALTLRVSRDLWRATSRPPLPPSPYGSDLARSVFVDVWGGTAHATEAFLRHLAAITQRRVRFLTVMQNWETGGFDALLPDSIWMPDYPPNPGVGSIDDFRRLSRTARSLGRFAMRTNYMVLRDASPSARAGLAHHAIDPDGKPAWHTRPSDWERLARRQETEIHRLFGTDAGFTDQLTSGGGPWSYTDYNAAIPEAGAMDETLALQRRLAVTIGRIEGGPVGSESEIDEQLLGDCISTGDFGIFDGCHRAFTPEFKLRRLQRLSTFHGMGLMYRYFEMPPFPRFSSGRADYLFDPAQYDDYRGAEVLFGNGGYLFYYPGMPWDYVMTECCLIGTLQRHYALQPVRDVRYWLEGRWQTLLDIVRAGIDLMPAPWAPQPDCLKRIRVTYANGLVVVVNRLAPVFPVAVGRRTVRLPKSGWVAWMAHGRLLAYSAYAPGTDHRIDFIRDAGARLKYVNPRHGLVFGADRPTLWLDGRVAVRLDPATGDAWVRGRLVPYRPPNAKPLHRIDFQFNRGVQGWVGQSGLGPLRVKDGRLTAEIVGGDPYLIAPTLDLAPDSVHAIVLRMSVTCGTRGKIYFQAAGVHATAEAMAVPFAIRSGAAIQEVRVSVSDNPLWRGHRITWLRLDPEDGTAPGVLAIESIRGE